MFTKIIKITVALLCLSALTVPSSVRSAAGDIQPFASASECPDANGDGHGDVTDNVDFGKFPDTQLYHDLWNEKAGCHYDHEHGDNPALADSYFGKAGQLWGGQSISYPFYTSPMENTHKHSGHKYYVRTPGFNPFPPCGTENVSDNNPSGIGNNCIIAARVILHTIAGTMDTLARYHSGYIEAYICKYPGYTSCGTIKTGGWFDFGDLKAPHYSDRVVRPGGTVDFGGIVMDFAPDGPDLPAQSGEPYVFMIDYTPEKLAEYRAHPPTAPKATMDQWSSNDFDCEPRPANDPCHNQYTHMLVQVGDSWNLLDKANPNNIIWICRGEPNCEYNGSLTGLNELWFKVLQTWQPSGNGFVTLTGWSDRWGNPRFDNVCKSVSVDCVPFVLDHAPVGTAAVRNDPGCECFVVEHDIYFNGKTSGWIKFSSQAHESHPTSTPPPSSPTNTPSSPDIFVSTDVNPANLAIGAAALVSVNLNNVPTEGYQSAEFTCTYNAGLVEKSNVVATSLFGADSAVVIHDSQPGSFIVAIAGANGNKATTSGTAFTFSLKGLQAGQAPIQCAARVSKGDNIPLPLPASNANLTVLGTEPSPTMPPHDSPTPTPGDGGHEHPTATEPPLGSPTPLPPTDGALTGQILASKPVTVTLYDANNVVVQSLTANPDGTFMLLAPAGAYTLTVTADGFLGYQGAVTLTAGNTIVKPAINLPAGDIDGNNVIDQFDALTIGMSYTSSTPSAADLNNDGVIDFLDLELLAENYRKTGPLVWE
ncbi:MAG: hypothetical protein DCC56_07025 [Anaerolineae bacterium]|nr:hypothetical protein [Anaerolineales bacterium]RIK31925.1 MAG: hypothetical protein DCC56_07025 [Anaerolineae bacterium]WKZ43390.1 MAG: carboxypeptidase regulatory-like domain-containing protein [Anaerolineales bacterium]WKZ46151.1 MAG: carboxypeptidase regulatory-like domain-containing protein [Anaerolineales bacterium]